MVSPRLILRLDEAIAQAKDAHAADLLRAERAGALARLGALADARLALAPLRTLATKTQDVPLLSWVALVNGLIAHFDALGPEARGYFEEARRLALQARMDTMRARAAAWLSNCEFNDRAPQAMAHALAEAQALAGPQDHDVLARVAMVRATAANLAGLRNESLAYFKDVRSHALADGDTATLGVLLHNRASASTDMLVLADALGEDCADDARRILLEVTSTINFDQSLGNQALGAMNPVMQGQLLMALRRWDEALALLETYLRRARLEGQDHRHTFFEVACAWCMWHADRREEALAIMESVQDMLGGLTEHDDRAIAHLRLAQLWTLADRPSRAQAQRYLGERALEAFRQLQQQFAEALRTTPC